MTTPSEADSNSRDSKETEPLQQIMILNCANEQ